MKPGNWIIHAVMWVMMAAIAAYFGVYAFQFIFDGYETDALYTYAAEELVQTSGCVIREEQVVEGGSELAAVIVSEGEKVAAGDTLALVYENQDALLRHWDIVSMEERLKSLKYIFSHSIDSADSAQLNRNIVQSIVDLKKAVSQGKLEDLPERSSDLKMLVFRGDYTYNGSHALTQEIHDLEAKTKALAESNRSYTTTITTPCSGTFSGMVDGYENVLTPDAVNLVSPARLEELLGSKEDVQEKVDNSEYLGKLVTDNRWYFATIMTEDDAANLKLGGTIPTRFNSIDHTVNMKVESISTPDDNHEVCVVLSSDRFMSQATLLRDQTADLILNTVTGFRVAKSAIHVENISGQIGVYRVFGTRLRWTPVEILWEDEDFYLIRQRSEYDADGNPKPMTALKEASRLRVGTKIVTKGQNLYDGKIIGER